MNHVERFRAVMNFDSFDRLPKFEWAMWWDETIARWKKEGLPNKLDGVFEISQYFELDPYKQFWISTTTSPVDAEQHHVEGIVKDVDDYIKIKSDIFPEHDFKHMAEWNIKQKNGDAVTWITLEGFFWFPRTLLGMEGHMYAFYDAPELIHMMNKDVLDYNMKMLQKIAKICPPTFMTFAEDMSYNHGPMLSKEVFYEFLAPYYREIIDLLNEFDIFPVVDTDGDASLMVPWLSDVGIKGILPLEKQAGIDAIEIRKSFPELRMIGHFDKMVMTRGKEAMRDEFERLLPAMEQGGFIPSVDHQTPPSVSLDQYYVYLGLLEKYCVLAAE